MTRLTYDIKVNGVVVAKDVPTLAEAERIKAENLGSTMTRVYTPIVEERVAVKSNRARIKLG